MEKNLGKIIISIVGGILLLAMLFPYKPQAHNLDEISFATTSEARLFFNNTRAFYYSFKDMDEAGFTVYEYGGTDKTNSIPCLNFFIVQNWRESEAYIMSKPSSHFQDSLIHVKDLSLAYRFEHMTNQDHFALAAVLFQKLINEEVGRSELDKIFGNAENTKANLTVLKDYFRLIEKYQ